MELNQREKLLIIVAALILVPLLVFRFAIVPLSEYQANQHQAINRLEKSINQIILLGEEVRYLNAGTQSQVSSLSKRVDMTLRGLRIKTKSQITVENFPGKKEQRLIMKVNDINLTELSSLVYRLENSQPIILIESIEISPSFQNKRLFRLSAALTSK